MTLIKVIADRLRKTPLFIPARTAYSLLVPSLRASRRQEQADLASITAKVGDALKQPLYGTEGANKSVLIMGMGRVRFIAQEAAVRKSFELAGYRCQVMVPQDSMVLKLIADSVAMSSFFLITTRPKCRMKARAC